MIGQVWRHLFARQHGLEPGAKAEQGERVNLRDPRFTDAEDGSGLLHGELFIVVERKHLLLFFAQFLDGADEEAVDLGLHGEEVGALLGIAGQVFAEIIVVIFVFALDMEAAEIEALKFAEQVLEGLEGKAKFGGDLLFGSRTAAVPD